MGLFHKMSEPVMLKEDSSAKEQLEALEALLPRASGKVKEQITKDIRSLKYGIYGEDQILFELKNSHYPMYVLHDLFLEDGDQTAQIDFYIITPKLNFVLECKNLYGDIEIDRAGNFVRTADFGGKLVKTGIYSPVTQNEHHMELIKKLKTENSGAVMRMLTQKNFYKFHRSLVVLANSRTVLEDREAPEEIRSQVIRADQLIRYIKDANARSKEFAMSEREMEDAAKRMLARHRETLKDYTAKYALDAAPPAEESRSAAARPEPRRQKKEPPRAAVPEPKEETVCPECGAKLVRKKGKYGFFWGCGRYPECRYTRNIVSPARLKEKTGNV